MRFSIPCFCCLALVFLSSSSNATKGGNLGGALPNCILFHSHSPLFDLLLSTGGRKGAASREGSIAPGVTAIGITKVQ